MWKKKTMTYLLAATMVLGFVVLASDAIAGEQRDQVNQQEEETAYISFFGKAPEFMDISGGTCTFDCGGGSQTVPAENQGDCACRCAATCGGTCSSGPFLCSVAGQP